MICKVCFTPSFQGSYERNGNTIPMGLSRTQEPMVPFTWWVYPILYGIAIARLNISVSGKVAKKATFATFTRFTIFPGARTALTERLENLVPFIFLLFTLFVIKPLSRSTIIPNQATGPQNPKSIKGERRMVNRENRDGRSAEAVKTVAYQSKNWQPPSSPLTSHHLSILLNWLDVNCNICDYDAIAFYNVGI